MVISLDLELAWGCFDLRYDAELLRCAEWTHEEGVPKLLGLLTRHRLAATWAVVGCLMFDSLPPGFVLPEVSYPHFHKPWFYYAGTAPPQKLASWFAPHVIQQICQASPPQELAAHSFSHVIFGDPGTSRERVRQELRWCQELARRNGVELRSFVFPRNSVAHLDLLKDAGFLCYRAPDEIPLPACFQHLGNCARLMCDLLALPPRLVMPRVCQDLVRIAGSLMIRDVKGWRNWIPDRVRTRRLMSGLHNVQTQGGVFHVWLHPEALYFRRPRLERVLAQFLEAVEEAVGAGRLRCLTMGQLALETLGAAHLVCSSGATPGAARGVPL